MKKSLFVIASAVALTAIPSLSFAQDSPLSFNVALSSDYRYRGISQTRLKPAISGGVDYAIPGGFYVGAWASSIRWIDDVGGDSKVEVDIYGGYKGEISKDFTFDVGALQYWYPNAKTAAWNALYKNPNTTEIYGGLTFGPATAKVSYALTNLFGNYDFTNNKDTKGSYYIDLSAGFDVGGGVTLTPHVGYQKVANLKVANYTDYSLTVSKDFSGFVVSLAAVGTDADKSFYVPGSFANSTKFLGKNGAVLSVKKTF
ncbi:MAG: TorF family putative porin [Burkholderiaceae bacterium]